MPAAGCLGNAHRVRSLGISLYFTGGFAPGPPPAFKKAGENQLKNFSGFPADYAGAPLIGSGALGLREPSLGGRFLALVGNPAEGGGAERRQWRKKRGGSPVSKGVEGSRLGGNAQRPLRTAGAERRQWRKKRGGSPVSKGVEGSRLGGDAQRPLGTAGAERRQWRKKRGGSPVSKGVEGSRFSGDAQRPLRTARGAAPPTGSRGRAPGGAWGSPPRNTLRYKLRYRSMYWRALLSQVKWARIPRVMRLRQEAG